MDKSVVCKKRCALSPPIEGEGQGWGWRRIKILMLQTTSSSINLLFSF